MSPQLPDVPGSLTGCQYWQAARPAGWQAGKLADWQTSRFKLSQIGRFAYRQV
jgi:hypothetical protein